MTVFDKSAIKLNDFFLFRSVLWFFFSLSTFLSFGFSFFLCFDIIENHSHDTKSRVHNRKCAAREFSHESFSPFAEIFRFSNFNLLLLHVISHEKKKRIERANKKQHFSTTIILGKIRVRFHVFHRPDHLSIDRISLLISKNFTNSNHGISFYFPPKNVYYICIEDYFRGARD